MLSTTQNVLFFLGLELELCWTGTRTSRSRERNGTRRELKVWTSIESCSIPIRTEPLESCKFSWCPEMKIFLRDDKWISPQIFRRFRMANLFSRYNKLHSWGSPGLIPSQMENPPLCFNRWCQYWTAISLSSWFKHELSWIDASCPFVIASIHFPDCESNRTEEPDWAFAWWILHFGLPIAI